MTERDIAAEMIAVADNDCQVETEQLREWATIIASLRQKVAAAEARVKVYREALEHIEGRYKCCCVIDSIAGVFHECVKCEARKAIADGEAEHE
jgi:hypothetical protein